MAKVLFRIDRLCLRAQYHLRDHFIIHPAANVFEQLVEAVCLRALADMPLDVDGLQKLSKG